MKYSGGEVIVLYEEFPSVLQDILQHYWSFPIKYSSLYHDLMSLDTTKRPLGSKASPRRSDQFTGFVEWSIQLTSHFLGN